MVTVEDDNMKFKIKWRFTDSYEESRVDIIDAKNRDVAIQVVHARHLEPASQTRASIQILGIERM